MRYYYVGNCVDAFDEDGITVDLLTSAGMVDASDFACVEEESIKVSKEWFIEHCNFPKHELIEDNYIFLYNEDRDVVMMYDDEKDIHYFFFCV